MFRANAPRGIPPSLSANTYFKLVTAIYMFALPEDTEYPALLQKSISELTEEEGKQAFELWMNLHLGRK